jgi:hypothetical protein
VSGRPLPHRAARGLGQRLPAEVAGVLAAGLASGSRRRLQAAHAEVVELVDREERLWIAALELLEDEIVELEERSP